MTFRVGRTVGRTLYDHGDDPERGKLIGLMDTPELAQRVVDAVNERDALRAHLRAVLVGLPKCPTAARRDCAICAARAALGEEKR